MNRATDIFSLLLVEMFFAETVLPKGTKLYKGQKVGCRMVPGSTRHFYVTTNWRVARTYGHPCSFFTRRQVRLFQMTPENLQRLLSYKGLTRTTKILLRLLFGVDTKRAHQVRAMKELMTQSLPGSRNFRTGQRLSIAELDHLLAVRLTKEFLRPELYDGYYAPGFRTMFHGGRFHAEMMLCDASRVLERNTTGSIARPLVDQSRLAKLIPELFIKYCQTHRDLLRSHRAFASVYLGGGMAVKLYLRARGKTVPPGVANTTDFDFTFATRGKVDRPALYVRAMRQMMTRHLTGFLAWINRSYRAMNVKLIVDDTFVPDIRLLPATKKYVYQVISYRLAFPGKEPVDFVDTTLAYVPGASREHIHRPFSRMYGIPLETLQYLYKNVAVVLAGSFLYKGIQPRNPLRGRRPEKGLKDTARLMALADYIPRRRNLKPLVDASRGMLRRIIAKNYTAGRNRAKSVIRHVV